MSVALWATQCAVRLSRHTEPAHQRHAVGNTAAQTTWGAKMRAFPTTLVPLLLAACGQQPTSQLSRNDLIEQQCRHRVEALAMEPNGILWRKGYVLDDRASYEFGYNDGSAVAPTLRVSCYFRNSAAGPEVYYSELSGSQFQYGDRLVGMIGSPRILKVSKTREVKAELPTVQPTTESPLDPDQFAIEDYPSQWGEQGFAPVATTLAQNRIKGCGEFSTKPSASVAGRYLVYCTSDGETWTSYLVDTIAKQVVGLDLPADRLPPPY